MVSWEANVKVLGQADMARLVVRGRGAHVASTLTTMGWSKGPAVTILAKCEAGSVQGSRYKAIGGLTRVEIPLINMDGKTKDGTAILDKKDLSKYICPETTASSEPKN